MMDRQVIKIYTNFMPTLTTLHNHSYFYLSNSYSSSSYSLSREERDYLSDLLVFWAGLSTPTSTSPIKPLISKLKKILLSPAEVATLSFKR
jgi:hypothetical protein